MVRNFICIIWLIEFIDVNNIVRKLRKVAPTGESTRRQHREQLPHECQAATFQFQYNSGELPHQLKKIYSNVKSYLESLFAFHSTHYIEKEILLQRKINVWWRA